MTFVLYCAGLSLVLLVVYVISSGKLFEFSANENGVVFKSALNHGTIASDSAQKRSAELKAKFEQASISPTITTATPSDNHTDPAPPPTPSSTFAGTWTGGGNVRYSTVW